MDIRNNVSEKIQIKISMNTFEGVRK